MGVQKIPPEFIPFVISNFPIQQTRRFLLYLFHDHSALKRLPYLSTFLINTDYHDVLLYVALTGPLYLFEIIFDVMLIRLGEGSPASLLENPFFRHAFFIETGEAFLFTNHFEEFMGMLGEGKGAEAKILSGWVV